MDFGPGPGQDATNHSYAIYGAPASDNQFSQFNGTDSIGHAAFGGLVGQGFAANSPSSLSLNDQDAGWTHFDDASPAMGFASFDSPVGRLDSPWFGPAPGFAPQPITVYGGFGPSSTIMTQSTVVGSIGGSGMLTVLVVSETEPGAVYDTGDDSEVQPSDEGNPLPQSGDQAEGWTRSVGVPPASTYIPSGGQGGNPQFALPPAYAYAPTYPSSQGSAGAAAAHTMTAAAGSTAMRRARLWHFARQSTWHRPVEPRTTRYGSRPIAIDGGRRCQGIGTQQPAAWRFVGRRRHSWHLPGTSERRVDCPARRAAAN